MYIYIYIQQRLEDQEPDLRKLSDMMSVREREEQEQRDAKVLRVLRTKDQTLATLNGQVEGLERVLEETRAKLAAADRALQDKLKDADRLWRDHNDALASSQVRARPPPRVPLRRCCTARARSHAPVAVCVFVRVSSHVPVPVRVSV